MLDASASHSHSATAFFQYNKIYSTHSLPILANTVARIGILSGNKASLVMPKANHIAMGLAKFLYPNYFFSDIAYERGTFPSVAVIPPGITSNPLPTLL